MNQNKSLLPTNEFVLNEAKKNKDALLAVVTEVMIFNKTEWVELFSKDNTLFAALADEMMRFSTPNSWAMNRLISEAIDGNHTEVSKCLFKGVTSDGQVINGEFISSGFGVNNWLSLLEKEDIPKWFRKLPTKARKVLVDEIFEEIARQNPTFDDDFKPPQDARASKVESGFNGDAFYLMLTLILITNGAEQDQIKKSVKNIAEKVQMHWSVLVDQAEVLFLNNATEILNIFKQIEDCGFDGDERTKKIIRNELRERALKNVLVFLYEATSTQNLKKMRGLSSMLDCADYIKAKPGYTVSYDEKEKEGKIWKEWSERKNILSYMRKETVKEKYIKESVEIGQMFLKSIGQNRKDTQEVMAFFEAECLKYSVKETVGAGPKGRRVL